MSDIIEKMKEEGRRCEIDDLVFKCVGAVDGKAKPRGWKIHRDMTQIVKSVHEAITEHMILNT